MGKQENSFLSKMEEIYADPEAHKKPTLQDWQAKRKKGAWVNLTPDQKRAVGGKPKIEDDGDQD